MRAAFSLIELSIVILIVGILIAGVTQGSRLIKDSKVKTAKTLTQSSDVSSIKDLILWLEPTKAESFVDNIENGDAIETWYDINPQLSAGKNPTQSGSDERPTYTTSGINGLPSLEFDGTDDYLKISNLKIDGDELEVFMVCKRTAVNSYTSTASFYVDGTNHDYNNVSSFVFAFEDLTGNTLTVSRSGTKSSQTHPGNGVPYIVSVGFDGTNNTVYLNGQAASSVASSGNFSIDNILIGTRRINSVDTYEPYDGLISEMIVFDRALKSKERNAVNDYLSKKYNISLN